MNSKAGLIIFFVVLLTSISFVSAITGSIGNARAILDVEVGFFGTTIERTILVKNVNDVPVNITLEAGEEFKDMVNIIDNEFTLQAGEEKKARFNVNIKKPGDYELRINVFFKSEGEKTGVALSSTLIIHAVKKGLWDDSSEEAEPIDEEVNSTDSITGNVVSDNENNKTNTPLIAVLISTLVLAAILIFLIFKIRSRKFEGEKINKRKRADRSS